MKGGQVAIGAISAATFELLKTTFKTYLEDIFGMLPVKEQTSDKLDSVLSVLIEMRKEAKTRKDFATSDQIRNKLAANGVILKDEKTAP